MWCVEREIADEGEVRVRREMRSRRGLGGGERRKGRGGERETGFCVEGGEEEGNRFSVGGGETGDVRLVWVRRKKILRVVLEREI